MATSVTLACYWINGQSADIATFTGPDCERDADAAAAALILAESVVKVTTCTVTPGGAYFGRIVK